MAQFQSAERAVATLLGNVAKITIVAAALVGVVVVFSSLYW